MPEHITNDIEISFDDSDSEIAVLNIKEIGYHCIIKRISKTKTINLLQNIDLSERSETLLNNKYQE